MTIKFKNDQMKAAEEINISTIFFHSSIVNVLFSIASSFTTGIYLFKSLIARAEQLVFTCLNSLMATPEQCKKSVRSYRLVVN